MFNIWNLESTGKFLDDTVILNKMKLKKYLKKLRAEFFCSNKEKAKKKKFLFISKRNKKYNTQLND